MTRRQAIGFIRYHGVVLQSAKGLEPSLVARIVGEPVRGSWWGHPLGQRIYALLQEIDESRVVLTCTLAAGRITYVHRRLWPAFVRVADRFPAGALDRVRQVHLPSGRHERQDVPFPDWVPGSVMAPARKLSLAAATSQVKHWLDRYAIATAKT